jgi:hypothetical protein
LTKDKYLDSNEETHPFSAVFYRDNNREFSVKFIRISNDGSQHGQYIVSTNYDPGINEFHQNITNSRWEKYFDSDKSSDVETLLDSLNNDVTVANIGL